MLSAGKWSKVSKSRHLYSILGLIKQGEVEKAEEVFQRMIQRRIKPDVVTYNALLKGYAQRNDIRKAFNTFNDIKKRGLIPSDRTYSSLFSACGNTQSQEVLMKVIEEIDRRQVTLNPIATNAMLSALVHCGMVEDVFDEYLKFPSPTIETIGTILLACSRSSLERVEEVWGSMYQNKLSPGLHCYNTLLLCLRDSHVPDHMTKDSDHVTIVPNTSKTLKASKEVTLTLKDLSLTLYLSGKIRWMERSDIKELFSTMKEAKISCDRSRVPLDKPLIKAAIERLRLLGDRAGVEEMIEVASELGIVNDLQRAKNCYTREETEQLLVHLKEVEGEPAVYEALIRNSIKRRDYDCSLHVLKEMKYAGVIPSDTLIAELDDVVKVPPKKAWLISRFNGFSGYYKLWKQILGIKD